MEFEVKLQEITIVFAIVTENWSSDGYDFTGTNLTMIGIVFDGDSEKFKSLVEELVVVDDERKNISAYLAAGEEINGHCELMQKATAVLGTVNWRKSSFDIS